MTSSVIGALRVNLSIDSAEFKRGLSEAERMADRFGKALGSTLRNGTLALGAGVAVATSALAALTKSSMETIGAQVDLARRVGASVGAIQSLQHAAELSGSSQEALAKALGTLNDKLGEAARTGAGSAHEALQRLGLSARELSQMDADERVKALSDRMAELGYSAQQTGDTLKQLGVKQQEVRNLFIEGSGAINEARENLQAWGVLLSNVDAAKVEAAGDAWDKIGTVMEGVGNQLAVRLSPLIQEAADYLGDAAKESGGFGSAIDKAISQGVHLFGFLNRSVYDFRVELDDGIAEVLNLFDAVAGFPANMLAKIFGGTPADYDFEPVNQSFGKLRETLEKPMSTDQLDQWLADIRAKADAAAAAVTSTMGLGGENGDGGGQTETQAAELAAFQEHLGQKLASLQESLMSEREAEMADYAQRLADLATFRANQLMTDEEFADLRLRVEEGHQAALKRLKDQEVKNQEELAKQKERTYWSAAERGADALRYLFDENKAVALGTAAVDIAAGIAKAMSLPWPLNWAEAAARAAQGIASIAAIRSAKPGGGSSPAVHGGGASSSAARPAPAQAAAAAGQSQTLHVSGLAPGQLLSSEYVREFAQRLIEFQRDGGKVVLE